MSRLRWQRPCFHDGGRSWAVKVASTKGGTDGWTNGQTAGQTAARRDGRMAERTAERTIRWTAEGTIGRTGERTAERTADRTAERLDGRPDAQPARRAYIDCPGSFSVLLVSLANSQPRAAHTGQLGQQNTNWSRCGKTASCRYWVEAIYRRFSSIYRLSVNLYRIGWNIQDVALKNTE